MQRIQFIFSYNHCFLVYVFIMMVRLEQGMQKAIGDLFGPLFLPTQWKRNFIILKSNFVHAPTPYQLY